MNENVKKYLGWLVVVVAILIAGYLGVTYPIPAPPVNVPPATELGAGAQAVEGRSVVISDTVAITADSYSSSKNWHRGSNPYTYADIYYAFDQYNPASGANTTTLQLQTSYDGATWFPYMGKDNPGLTDGGLGIGALVLTNTVDTSGSMTVKVQWPYMRLYYDVSNTQAVTVSSRLYLR